MKKRSFVLNKFNESKSQVTFQFLAKMFKKLLVIVKEIVISSSTTKI